MTNATVGRGLRRGYMMQFWGALYALSVAYPDPGLSALVAAVIVLLAALIYDARPAGWSA